MANNVFANGLEIACKAGDGKSVACFPDPCFSPPDPSKVILPYANTAYAKDTANGSKTVFISGKPVMKKDHSHFKTSTGNEPAAGLKGVVTGVKKGKAYFASWSMNVMVEGQNVDRHTDMMTHNHGSVSGNTAVWNFIDTKIKRGSCKKDFNDLEKKCKPTKEKVVGRRKKKVPDTSGGAWKRNYCKGLMHNPPTTGKNGEAISPDKIKDDFNSLLDAQAIAENAMGKVIDIMSEKATEFALKKGVSIAGKAAIKGWLGPVGWLWTAYDVVSAGMAVNEMWDVINEMKADLKALKELKPKLEAMKEGGITAVELADAQALIAKTKPCLRARKCMLQSYTDSDKGKNKTQNVGCCAGQTGHHVLPNSQFNAQNCPGYQHGAAPTICLEGTSHSRGGSHGAAHKSMTESMSKGVKAGLVVDGDISYAESKKMAIDSVRAVAPNCSPACIEAQLDKYHKEACGQQGDFNVRASDGIAVRHENNI